MVPVSPRTRLASSEEMTAAIQLVQEHLQTLAPQVPSYNPTEVPPARMLGRPHIPRRTRECTWAASARVSAGLLLWCVIEATLGGGCTLSLWSLVVVLLKYYSIITSILHCHKKVLILVALDIFLSYLISFLSRLAEKHVPNVNVIESMPFCIDDPATF